MREVRTTASRAIFSITIALMIVSQQTLFAGPPVFGPYLDLMVLFFGAYGTHELIHGIVFGLLDRSTTFQKMLWGDEFLRGFWVFSSLEGTGGSQRKLRGIWRIDQNIDGVAVIGFGVSDALEKRTRVHSVSKLMKDKNIYQIINQRNDFEHSSEAAFSTSTFSLDSPVRRGLFRYSVVFRGETQIFGGPRSGVVLTNARWEKIEAAKTEEDVLTYLSENKEQKPD